jgi:hypothetical protein
MSIGFLVRLHVDLLTLFKRLLTKEQMSMQKVNGKIHLHLTCGNSHDGIISILFMVLNLFIIIICFINHKLYTFV